MYYWACSRIVCHKKAGKRKKDLHVQEMIIEAPVPVKRVNLIQETERHFMIAVKHLKIIHHLQFHLQHIHFTIIAWVDSKK